MTLYRLGVSPSESEGEGEDHDEWFTSFKAAKARRAQWIRNTERLKYGSDFEIERVVVADLPKRELVLAILNRYGGTWRASSTEVVPAWVQPDDDEGGEE